MNLDTADDQRPMRVYAGFLEWLSFVEGEIDSDTLARPGNTFRLCCSAREGVKAT